MLRLSTHRFRFIAKIVYERKRSAMDAGRRANEPRRAGPLDEPRRIYAAALADRRAISPSELAPRLDCPVNVAAYHMKVLRDNGILELVELKPVGGAVKHMYRTTGSNWIEQVDWGRIPESLRPDIAKAVLQAFNARMVEATELDAFDFDRHARLALNRLTLDEAALPQLVEVIDWARGEARELEAEAAKRRARGETRERIPVTFTIGSFGVRETENGEAGREHP
jgi:ribosomal protein S25